ncbi:MAG: extracellular solute-binding protein, partial [Gammaproteobacteria bacterium]|nr:extracellular solute-binding protein [Gammaproteobacteria bacterium]
MAAQPSGVSAADPVTLVYWSYWNEPETQAQVMKSWMKAFMKRNPHITIEAVWNGRKNGPLARSALNVGTQIDLINSDATILLGGLVQEGAAYPLNDFLTQKALDQDLPISDLFLPGVLDLCTQGDRVYLWPYRYNPILFWYNKDIFEEAGVEAPKTWEEFLAVNDAILKTGYAPIALEGDIGGYQAMYFVYLVSRARAPGFLRTSVTDKTGESWRDPVYLDTARKIRALWDRGYIPAESVGNLWPAGQQTLAFGEAAMELCGAWLPIELAGATGEGFRWGAFNFPTVEGGQGSRHD